MRRRATMLGAVCAGLAQLAGFGRAEAQSLEYAIKAAYLTKFVPFITWPDGTFPAPNAPVTICVAGGDPFGGKLEEAAAGAKFGDHPLVVRKAQAADQGCQIAFLPPGSEGALDALRGKPVLTVTDSGGPARGVIGFVIDNNHVRFDIDDALAAQDGLAVSSKLLSLAHAVKPREAAP